MHKHLPPRTFGAKESKMATLMWLLFNDYAIADAIVDDFSDVARQIQTAIAQTKTKSLNECPLYTFLQYQTFQIFRELRGKRTITCNFTNHGECSWVNGNDDEAVTRVVSLLPLANHTSFGSVFWWFATTINQRMFFTVNYVTHAVSDDDAREHLQQSISILVDACRQN